MKIYARLGENTLDLIEKAEAALHAQNKPLSAKQMATEALSACSQEEIVNIISRYFTIEWSD